MSIKSLLKRIPGVEECLEHFAYARKLDLRSLSQEKRIEMLMDKYERIVGYRMDIYHPITYTEKLQWYKTFYKGDGNLERVVDKYLFKGYIEEKLGKGYTVPLIGVWENIKDLEKDWHRLPEEFCLKSTIQSDGNYIKFIHKKSSTSFGMLKRELKDWLLPKNTLANSFCIAYHKSKPRIIAEQYLENVKDQLYDYKFYCFDGEPFCCCVNTQHFEKGKEHTFPITYYDIDWNMLDVKSGVHEIEKCEKPRHYEEMLEISRQLSKDFPHVRVDFFDTDEKLYVAELTLYPGGGMFKYQPEEFNQKMGELFKLPITK